VKVLQSTENLAGERPGYIFQEFAVLVQPATDGAARDIFKEAEEK
jgi:hypothetical protein